MEGKLLNLENLNLAKEKCEGQFFVVSNNDTLSAFHVLKVESRSIDDSDTIAICAIGKDILVTENLAVSTCITHPILDDLHFGVWDNDTAISRDDLQAEIISRLEKNGHYTDFYNDCDVAEFFQNNKVKEG